MTATTAYAALAAFCDDRDNPANSVEWLAEYDRLNAAYIAAQAIDAEAPGTYRGYVYADHLERCADE